MISLAAIVGGAELFVTAIEEISTSLGLPLLVLALILAPLATELPEKANSVLWVRTGKDTLAAGNVTGAMAFQATIPVAFGLARDAVGAQRLRRRRGLHRTGGRHDRAVGASAPHPITRVAARRRTRASPASKSSLARKPSSLGGARRARRTRGGRRRRATRR